VNDLPPSHASHASHSAAAPAHSPDASLVKSPMVGTFYRAPEPGAPPFIDIGHEVTADTIVCIIEVMKLMNSIPAGASGVVTQIPVADGEPVEYGQVLMTIEPRR
jgi:acetyl-CoA carboxylase biotin carboxyl carrier protein